MADEDPTEPQERPESEPPVDERHGSALFGVPAMIAILVVAAAASISHSVFGAILAAGGVLLLFLAIGLAMTIAKRE
jgi:threonine/homoserine/homoserine lactone efflux protein